MPSPGPDAPNRVHPATPGPAGTARAFRPAVALRPLVGFFAVGLGLSALYATTGVGVICPFRAVTGWECPLCGGTRMGSALLHGDVTAAFAFNPLALVGITLLGIVGVLWVVEALGGPAVRPPLALRQRLMRTTHRQRLVAFFAVAVVYTVLRNTL